MGAIGFFDSGMGGLTVLKAAAELLPNENFIYYGDNANAPYGIKNREDILTLTAAAAEKLVMQGIKALVLACNTATSAAAAELRQRLDIPIVAIEPALKPAHAMGGAGQIVILATPATLALPRFQHSMALYGENAVPIPLEGLVELIEQGITRGPQINALLESALAGCLKDPINAIVLGCTHYPFVSESIHAIVGKDVPLIDGSAGTAAQLKRVLEQRGMLAAGDRGSLVFQSSGGEHVIAQMKALYYEVYLKMK